MSDFDQDQQESNGSEEQGTTANQQTLTFDGRVYPMQALPPEAINLLNDLIRSENELNEHRFRMRQLAAAQQSLTAALGQIIQNAGIEPIAEGEGEGEGFKPWIPNQEDNSASEEVEAA